MWNAAQAYSKVAKETASPREVEATLLLRAAARLQAVRDGWDSRQNELDDALVFNRKLWSIFLTSATSSDNPLPVAIRQNITSLGVFVLQHTVSLASDRRPERLASLITINRELAAGLRGQA